MSDYTALFFDLDGTLTDPKEGITRSIQYGLAKYGIHEEDMEKLALFIGPPLFASLHEFYGLNLEQAREVVAYYRERFGTIGLYENIPYVGIAELLQTLKDRGIRLFVATSKPTLYAQQILEHFQLAQYFDYVAGTFMDEARTDKAEVIEHIFETYPELRNEKIAMIGDRKFDILGGRKHGLDTIAVDYGYAPTGELGQHSPTYHVATVQELTALLLAHTATVATHL